MRLDEKLKSISAEQTVEELNEILSREKKIYVSWTGSRLISVNGYEEEVEISQIAKKYFDSSPFNETNSTLKERLNCYNLWEKIENIYKISEDIASNNRVKNIVLSVKEFSLYTPLYLRDPKINFLAFDGFEPTLKSAMFYFSKQQFKEMWPDQRAKGARGTISNEELVQWKANKAMVEDAIGRGFI